MMRPTVQPIAPARGTVEIFGDDLLDEDVLSDLDKAFEAIQIGPAPAPRKKTKAKRFKREREMAQMRVTFISITQVHLRPTLRYLKAIQLGVASRDLCEIIHYVIAPIIGKTRKVGLIEHTKALISFQRVLKNTLKTRSHRITREQQLQLKEKFSTVQKVFELDFRGHSMAVVNLLGFYKELKRDPKITEVELKKLFAIGIPSLTMLRKSSIEELVSLSGISSEQMSSLRWQARKFNVLSFL